MDFTDKHLIFISDVDKFFYLYADSLVAKCGVDASSLVAIVYKSGRKETLKRIEPFGYINFDDSMLVQLASAKTITFMSLLSWNAPIFKSLVESEPSCINKLYILITDDEVDKWNESYQEYGEIRANPNVYISSDDLFVLSIVKNFIVPSRYFKKTLESVLQRDDFVVHDASVIFDILPSQKSESLRDNLFEATEDNCPRVLLGTKGAGLKTTLSFLKKVDKKSYPIQVLVFSYSIPKRLILDAYLIFLRLIFGSKIEMMYLAKMSPTAYNAILASCTHILLQDRGGVSTARLFLKWGIGQLIIKADSANEKVFKNIFGIEFIKNQGSIVLQTMKYEVLENNAKKIQKEELRSIETYKNIYKM